MSEAEIGVLVVDALMLLGGVALLAFWLDRSRPIIIPLVLIVAMLALAFASGVTVRLDLIEGSKP